MSARGRFCCKKILAVRGIFTLDGEAVVVGPNGLTDFEALRRRGSGDVAVLYAFDLLEYDGSDLRRMPLETRKATLASLLKQSGVIRLSEHISAEGPDVFAHACRLGAEGIVSKRLGSAHSSGLPTRLPSSASARRRGGIVKREVAGFRPAQSTWPTASIP